MAKWIPDKSYPCFNCGEKDGFDIIYHPSDDLFVLGDRIFCKECIEEAETVYNLLHAKEWDEDDLSETENKVVDNLHVPKYLCRSCQDAEWWTEVRKADEMRWYNGEDHFGAGFYCFDCLSNKYIDEDKQGPLLSEIVEWEREQRLERIKINKMTLEKEKEYAKTSSGKETTKR